MVGGDAQGLSLPEVGSPSGGEGTADPGRPTCAGDPRLRAGAVVTARRVRGPWALSVVTGTVVAVTWHGDVPHEVALARDGEDAPLFLVCGDYALTLADEDQDGDGELFGPSGVCCEVSWSFTTGLGPVTVAAKLPTIPTPALAGFVADMAHRVVRMVRDGAPDPEGVAS